MGPSALALIPARGGSKRLPRKNVIDFRGKPIIAYTIEAARESGCFDRVVVSTEDAEIAEIAAQFGAEVDIRPHALASDSARVVDVCLELLDREERISGRHWERLAVLYATAPLRGTADIRGTYALLEPGLCDFALAVTDYSLPPHQALALGDDNALRPMWPDLVNRRSSDLPRLLVDNGSTYVVDTTAFVRSGSFYGPGLRGHIMPIRRSVDIDTAEDFEFALWAAVTADKTFTE